MKSNKSLVIGAIVITLSIIIIGISGSYAYFVNSVQEKNSENKGVTVSSGDLNMSFTTSAYIDTDSASLIDDGEITTKADSTSFSVGLPSDASATSALYDLYLTDITMTNNFKSADVKWALYKDGSSVATGNFSSVELTNSDGTLCAAFTSGSTPVSCTGAKINLQQNINITKGKTDNYSLYIWLSNATDRNQLDLLEGSLKAKVAFRAITE